MRERLLAALVPLLRVAYSMNARGGACSHAQAANDQGEVAGYSKMAVSPTLTVDRALIYTAGTITDLGTLGRDNSQANSVNNDEIVVGQSDTAVGKQAAFVWSQDKGMVDLSIARRRDTLTRMTTSSTDQCLRLLKLMGFSVSEICFGSPGGCPEWQADATRDGQTILAKASMQRVAWAMAVRWARITIWQKGRIISVVFHRG